MKKGFTLIELIIVIAVIAVLGTTVILVLNPARILAEARDSQRIADLEQLKKVMILYIGLVNGPEMITTEVPNQPINPVTGGLATCTGTDASCFVHDGSGVAIAALGCKGADGQLRQGSSKEAILRSSRAVNGVGWIPVDFENMSTGAALAVLPIDPKNNDPYFYTYACGQVFPTPAIPYFEFTANMESERFACGGNDDVEFTDGGNMPGAGQTCANPSFYEVGNFPGLSL